MVRAARTWARRSRHAVVIAGFTAAATIARAQPEDPRAIEARKACAVGDVARGVALLADYLATTDDVTAIYNMGRCYQQNGRPDKALLQFREYLRKARNLTADDRREIAGHIEELQADQRVAAAGVGGAGAAPTGLSGSPGAGDRDRGRKLRAAGLAVGAAGAAGAAAGLFFGLRARSLEEQITRAATFDEEDNRAGKTAHTMQFVMYGVGAAAIAGGAALYWLGLDGDRRVSVFPSFHTGGGGALLRIPL